MLDTNQIDFAETRKLALSMVTQAEKILALLAIREPATAARRSSSLQISVIRGVVAAHFGFTSEQMLKPDRRAKMAWARMVAMFLCRELTACSLEQIGADFKRDHGCVMNACKVVHLRCTNDDHDGRQCAAEVLTLRAKLAETPLPT